MQKQKKLIAVAIATIAVIAVVLVFARQDDSTSTPVSTTEQSRSDNSSNASTPPTSASAGAYLDYSEDALASASGEKIIFFHAPWCPQCRALEESIKKGTIPSGVSIFKVDYDSSTDLKKKYGVTLQTTLVKVDDSGNLVKKYVAYSSPTLDSLKSNLLE